MTARTQRLTLASLAAAALALGATAQAQTPAPGAVYTSTNATDGNQVAIYSRAVDGTATFDRFVDTGGLGSGGGLGNQGAVTLSDNGRWLYVVNAGSDSLSVFRVRGDGLELVQTIGTVGTMPVSVAQHDRWVYVVNAGDDTIQGFRQRFNGTLLPLQGAYAPLSNSATAPAQIGFSPDGSALYVTEKATNVIDVYRLSARGIPLQHDVLASPGDTPFGFAFGQRDQLFVSEANGGADGLGTVSGFDLRRNGLLNPLQSSVATGETATCWVVIEPSGRLMFVSNTASRTISSFAVSFDGEMKLLDAQAANVGETPLDMALTRDGQFFYVLNAGSGTIGDYVVGADGSLVGIPGTAGGLPTSVRPAPTRWSAVRRPCR
ncbi:MAG: beta-propeller fold lactonase family protein, partial [Pseudomonadota bacterium]